MERVRIVEHESRQVVLVDFSGVTDEPAALQIIADAATWFAARPAQRHLLTLTDLEGSSYTAAVFEQLKEYARANEPKVIAAAVVGLSGVLRLGLRVVSLAAGRKIGVFKTRDEALRWLVRQTVPPRSVPEAFVE